MAIQFDDIHWSSRTIDGYNKDINFIYGPREPGKTTYMWVKKIYTQWKKDKKPWIYIVRRSVEISEALIHSIFDVNINKFTDDNVEPKYNKGSFKDGVVDVRINGEIFIRVVSLNIDLRRIKLAILRNAKGAYMDEYSINPKKKEKYLPDEWGTIKEAYTTWRRECEGRFKIYITSNIYSDYNPIFVALGVEGKSIAPGSILVGDYWAIEKVKLTDELRAWLLEQNPFYKFDEDYAAYALEGTAMNDKNIKLGVLPKNFYLQFIFKAEGHLIGVFNNRLIENHEDKFFCQFIDNYSEDRTVYCFDFDDLVANCALISREDRMKFQRFKKAMQRNLVAFSTVAVYYLIIDIYTFL